MTLELQANLIALLGSTILDERLNDSTGVVLEDDVFDFAADDVHKLSDVLLAFLRCDVFQADLGPDAFGVNEKR